jgi:hypothetical protein
VWQRAAIRQCTHRGNSPPNSGIDRKPGQTEPTSVEPALRATGMISTMQAPDVLMPATLIRTLE